MLQMSGLGTTRTNVHNHQYAKDAENMTYKKTINVLTAKETMALVLEIVRYGRKITKLKHTQNITYPETRMVDYKIWGSDKKYPNNQKTKLL